MTPKTVVRGGWGMSYIHFHRIGAANILSINGPQVVNAVVSQSNPTLPTFRTTQQGYPAGLADPSQFNPLTANILYIPRDYHSSVVQSWYVSVQREIAKNMLLDVAYVGNRADDLLSLANYNQAVPNNPAGSLSLQARRPIQEFGDITYTSNDGKSRYNALQVKFEYRMPGNLMLLNAFTWSQAKDNGAGSLEAPNGNVAGPQDFYNREADYAISGYNQPLNNTTSFVWDLPFGQGRRWMKRRQRRGRRVRRRLDLQRHQHDDVRCAGDAHLHSRGVASGVGHQPGVPRARTTTGRTSSAIRTATRTPSPTTSARRTSSSRPTRARSSATPSATA